jgi:DNA-binding response OmpR family regulator
MTPAAKTRILVADDEPNIRLMLRTVLGNDNCRVDEAANGEAALEAIQKNAFDILILDLNMPRLDGLGVLEALKTSPPNSPPRTIVLTAYGSIEKAVKATRLGALDFLEKPITPEELRNTVAAVLREPQPASAPTDADDQLSGGYAAVLDRVRQALRSVDIPTAETLLMRAADLAQDDAAYLNLLGILYESRRQWRLARKFYGKAMRADKRYEAAQNNMRRLYELETFGRSAVPVALGGEPPDFWLARPPAAR